MNNEKLHKNIMQILSRMYPQKADIAKVLMDILQIEREAIYRRIRGEVPFSLFETAAIAKKLGLSFDYIISFDSPKSIPFYLRLIEYANPTNTDYAILEEVVRVLQELKNEPYTEGGEATNILPQPIYLKYDNISRFYLFKWKYLSETPNKNTLYRNTVISERLRELQLENATVSKYITKTEYILDNLLFTYIVNDIRYFRTIDLISKEDARLVKLDLLSILDELETLTLNGEYTETGNKVDFYISNINFTNSYCYVSTQSYQIILLKSLILNAVASLDSEMYVDLKVWLESLKRQSTLITQSGEKQRLSFLSNQKEIINSL